MQATDGNFYGTTTQGAGAYGNGGTVFKIAPSGMLTTLYSFCAQTDCADGAEPLAGLVQAADGNFYGATYSGGPCCGKLFKITPAGTLTTLYTFYGGDGGHPVGGLVQATDGNFYGTTYQGGGDLYYDCNGYGCGTVFRITPSGHLDSWDVSTITSNGFHPYAGLVQASDGNLYGTTYAGGANDLGTVFRFYPVRPLQFVPVTPCRLVDTRKPNGEFGGPPIQGGTFRSFAIPDNKGCNIPSTAAAYSLNVTVVPQGSLGYVTIWPTGWNQPVVSTLNSLDGRVKANAAIVQVGVSAAVSVFASNTTDLVLDIDGYFAARNDSTLAFYPLPPCRVADTRYPNNEGLGAPHLTGGVPRDLPILNSNCGLPLQGVQAYSFNFTAVPHVPLGYLTVWPAGQSQPVVSTLNSLTGTVVANAAIVPAGTRGDIEAFASNDSDVVIDVNGYFAEPTEGDYGLSLYPVAPCRVLDTRNGNGAFVGELTVDVVGSVCAPPSYAQAYVFNATVVPTGGLGYLTLWPDGEGLPLVSTLNAIDGAITSNMAIVPNINGNTDAYASGITQLILDISSYFAP